MILKFDNFVIASLAGFFFLYKTFYFTFHKVINRLRRRALRDRSRSWKIALRLRILSGGSFLPGFPNDISIARLVRQTKYIGNFIIFFNNDRSERFFFHSSRVYFRGDFTGFRFVSGSTANTRVWYKQANYGGIHEKCFSRIYTRKKKKGIVLKRISSFIFVIICIARARNFDCVCVIYIYGGSKLDPSAQYIGASECYTRRVVLCKYFLKNFTFRRYSSNSITEILLLLLL